MGTPIGCPNGGLSTELSPVETDTWSWGTHRSRTKGSIAKARKIVNDLKDSGRGERI